MTLRMNFSRENFHARYPGFCDLALALISNDEFTRVHPSLRQFLRERRLAVITRAKRVLSSRVDPLPEVGFFVHFTSVILSEAKNLGSGAGIA